MENTRYNRQILLDEIGEAGQQKLLNAKVLVVGAGGLGCPVLQYLTAAGIGTIGVVDFDFVDLTNLQRQVLYQMEDIGKLKVETAVRKLSQQNPDVKFKSFPVQLTTQNALEIISEFDLVVDGTDNFQTRYLINDVCVILKKPLIYGAVLRFEGQIGVMNLTADKNNAAANYRDLFPSPPDPDQYLSCNDVGVLGVVPGMIGMLQANEAIKIITGVGDVLSDKILTMNFLNYSTYVINISPAQSSAVIAPKNESEFLNFDYEWFCRSKSSVNEIRIDDFIRRINDPDISVIDVREVNEMPKISDHDFISLPMSRIENSLLGLDLKNTVILICQSGIRSQKAAKKIQQKFPSKQIFSLKGGVDAWLTFKKDAVSNNE